jgi:hypothetical protein
MTARKVPVSGMVPASAPRPPENKAPDHEQTIIRRKLLILSLQHPTVAESPGLGEILLPFFFAAMETCWIDAIFIGLVGIDLFQTHAPLMPLWAPFLLLVGSQWILNQLERRAAIQPGKQLSAPIETQQHKTAPVSSWPLILFIAVATLFIVWLSAFAQTAMFLDPRWLLAMVSDFLFLNLVAFHVFVLIALSLYFCWRGMRLLYRDYEPSHIFSTLRLGMAIIFLVILVRAGEISAGAKLSDDTLLLLLIPIFLFLSLAAHSLAKVNFLRHTRKFNQEDSILPHERAILVVIGAIGIVLLLIAWIVDTVASPTLLLNTERAFSWLGQVYDWLVQILAVVFVFLATPIFWLFDLYFRLFPQRKPLQQSGSPKGRLPVAPHGGNGAAALIPIIKILLPLVLLLCVFLLIRWILRNRRRVRLVRSSRAVELHESVWSWALFWAQLRALLFAFFSRFTRRRKHGSDIPAMEEIQGEPPARTIREIYRALLKRASARGFPRKKFETPYEFHQRLAQQLPASDPQLALLTEIYIATRYGSIVPDQSEVARVQQAWAALQREWQEGT